MGQNIYDLTNPQKSIWYTEQFFKGSTLNNICGSMFIDEIVDFDLLKKAINQFVKDNDGFRFELFYDENGEIKQKVVDFEPFDIELVDLKSKDEISNLENDMTNEPFSLIENKLYRLKMYRLPDNKGGFLLIAHHLIYDAYTASLVTSKVVNIYSAFKKGEESPEKPTSYINYINNENEYLQSDKFEKDKEYWNSVFETIPEIGTIPSIHETTENSCKALRRTFTISKEKMQELNEFCSNNKISIFNLFMGLYAIYIGKVSNLDDFVIGTPILNRSNFEEKNTPGTFISTVPFRFVLDDSKSFIDFEKEIASGAFSMFRHQKYPYQNILDDIRKKNPSQPNLYDILISYQNARNNRNSSDIPYRTRWTFNDNVADSMQIHLFDINDDGALSISYDYRTNKYDEIDIENIHNRILYIIEQILFKQDLSLGDISIVTPKERDVILNKFNDTYLEYDKTKTVVDYFEEQVEKTPENIALVCNDKYFTYKELNNKANQLAHFLISNNVKSKDIVGIMVHRSPEMIIGLLAILKIGACYLPIDPEYPKDRIKYMLEDSECSTILVHSETMHLLEDNFNYIDISLDSSIYSSSDIANLNISISGEDLIYMIYTSGSTGNPKGVMLTHNNINNFILGEKQHIDFSKNKVMLSVTTICFDIFALEIWCSLTSGIKVVLANDDEQMNPVALKSLCEKYNVNMIQTTPSRYSVILSDISNSDFLSNFSDIMVGGEPFPKALLEKLKEISNANIFNMYGPTETTVWSTIKDLTNTNEITIGKPIANTTCYILDKNKHLLPTLVPGELYIGGDGVSKGYWKRENLTNERFVKSPFNKDEIIYNTGDLAYFNYDGELIHLGRTDFQVKIRGYRIELEEIQSKLLEFPGIKDCVVIAKDTKFLVCYYIANEEYSSSKISAFLLNYLPSYMVPAYYIKIDSIPMTPNGKLNRALLPEVSHTDEEIEEAKTDTELKISSVISKIINVTQLDINTPFINLGLDSLGIIKAQTMLLKFGFVLTTQDFYKYSSIKKLAEKIDSNIVDNTENDITIPLQFCHSAGEITSNISSIDIDEDAFNNIFLTGANGFVGVHILHELLVNTNNIIYCLVRGKNKEHSFERLRKTYNFYFGIDISKYIDSRIRIICSDIDAENFGLTSDEINDFSTIIHTAAIVKHYGNFDDFEKINIRGTENVAKFAHSNNKRLIHISSISVSGNYLVKQDNRDIDFSENSIYIGQHYNDNVYVRSKLEAEKIILSYMKQGLVAQIHRIGILAGRYSDGVFQEKIAENAFYARIKSMLSLGAISDDMLEQEIEFTPVDYCARAIVTLGKHSACNNKIFHLYNPNLIEVKNLIELFKKYNIDIKVLSKQEFNDYIYKLSVEQKDSSLNSIINDISYDANHLLSLNYDFTVNIKSEFTQQYLYLLNFSWPESNDIYIEKILDYMISVGFLGL